MFSIRSMRMFTSLWIVGALLPISTAGATTTVTIANSAPRFSNAIQVLGDADPAVTVHIQIALRLRNADDLTARTNAGEQLAFDDLAAHYLPRRSDQDAVIAWLRSQGLTIERTHETRLTVGAFGTAHAVGHAFRVRFQRILSERKLWTATDEIPSVPSALADVILSVNGLQPQLHLVPLLMKAPGAIDGYTPADFISAYKATSLGLKGAATTTAIVIDTFPKKSDLTAFWAATKTAQKLANITFIKVNPGNLPEKSGEETLDTEISSSIGPSSKVRVYASISLDSGSLDNDFQKIIADLKAGVRITQVSISLGGCETSFGAAQARADDQFFSVIQSLGASVFVSSGDSGSYECGGSIDAPSFYSTSPNVTAVGGTTLNLTKTATRADEVGWEGSGGGDSTIFSQPGYQQRLINYNVRTVPDVSADANPNTGAYIIIDGQGQPIGGTSLSAPLWAGLTGLINATRLAKHKKTVGAINPKIYPLLGKDDFYDVVSGSNGGYRAAKGYDLVTGIGTPDLSVLLPVLADKP